MVRLDQQKVMYFYLLFGQKSKITWTWEYKKSIPYRFRMCNSKGIVFYILIVEATKQNTVSIQFVDHFRFTSTPVLAQEPNEPLQTCNLRNPDDEKVLNLLKKVSRKYWFHDWKSRDWKNTFSWKSPYQEFFNDLFLKCIY